ncbi:MAG: hypothetical protein ACD_44C00001G0009 [uncultured bacterium]|nr:MAG: hypothetical protein ACD_44C00001G0009 [uncultured bacterium]
MDIVRKLAVIFGVAFIAAGIAGFIPGLVTDGNLLLGIFEIDSMHNGVHLLSGIIALVSATQFSYARLYFQVFGVIYTIVAILGFITEGNMMHMNMADNLLHLVIGIASLYIGFVLSKSIESR